MTAPEPPSPGSAAEEGGAPSLGLFSEFDVAPVRAWWRALAVGAARRVGLFEEWGAPSARGSPRTVDVLARRLGIAPHRLQALIEVLQVEGVVSFDGGSLQRSVKVADDGGVQPEAIDRLVEALRHGGGAVRAEERQAEAAYLARLATIGGPAAVELWARLGAELPGGASRLLDVGSGLGVYAAAWLDASCAHRAVLLDRPDVAARAQGWLGLGATRAQCVGADLGDGLAAALGGALRFDVVLLSNVLHLLGPSDCRRLLQEARALLTEGGILVVKELRLEADRSGPARALAFGLNMVLHTDEGRAWDVGQLGRLLGDAGCSSWARFTLEADPTSVVLVGRCPTSSEQS